MTKAQAAPIIVWFRKDLRLADNRALAAAAGEGAVIPLYIREPVESGNGPLGAAQLWWLHHSLEALGGRLAQRGLQLILRSGDPLDVIGDLARATGADRIYWNRRYDPAGIATDAPLKKTLVAQGITAESFAGQLLHEPMRLLTTTGGPYRVFTPFWRALGSRGEPAAPIDEPHHLAAPQAWPMSERLDDWSLLPKKPDWAATFAEVWTPGEQGAAARLEDFIDGKLDDYKRDRDFPDANGTSLLSPHLAFGEISPSKIWHATARLPAGAGEGVATFRKELAWREFSYHLLFHYPELPARNLNRRFDGFRWMNADDDFTRWTKGMTGFPIVDAGMRQLWRHGYMHNRVRMIAASFLIKDLLIDWRQGEAWFRDTLLDADPANNAASWQWVAGSGADAAPFFRIFNPILQGEKFDPDGHYVKRFVPELERLAARYIHRPFAAPATALEKAGIKLGTTYPKPIVDHAVARDRALAAFREITSAAREA
ncbi:MULTISPECIES: deoxyribodipyrimidine photo-lyase [unclassified Ensifer]|uniref:cryptochrome/photolyase family protein n=1 Tax=unclassified Ensifer TaxID=2633371 RepID=UPI0008133777|nr:MULTISPECIES: deoxyribodipyrimidine photo-lyase [unclassified Ensifer]OCP01038.1 deoxyribodipyrimidine photolyase [Ensifer sp. LC11]OCP01612.1 deoxyribodipyrimidine photolyase [Ensifer sp. LC13]OCP02160.1 deoxyribodipyrimidine photolyase [Ensifer sp. LC14]OCP30008.1 deoxyribodipyrimidine photolyase [Ensifer sp. LC499]